MRGGSSLACPDRLKRPAGPEWILAVEFEQVERAKHHGVILHLIADAADGETVYRHACALGREGIVSKRLGLPYKPGRVDHWLKIKNPASPPVKRDAKKEWRK